MPNQLIEGTKSFFAGGVGGVCAVASGHPLDTIKVRLQTMPAPTGDRGPLYNGTLDCLQKTIKHEGFRGLYKGMAAPIAGVTPIFALSFLGFDIGKKIVRKCTNDQSEQLGLGKLFVAGGFAGVLTTAIMAPGERIKCLLQVQASSDKKLYNGPMDVVKKLYKQGGMKSIYRGTLLTLARDVPASGMYFASYQWLKQIMTPAGKDPSTASILFAGGMAGIFNWAVAIPPDVLKSKYQTNESYKRVRDVYKDVLKNDGFKGMYRGFVPVMLRAFPANACCFMGYELAMKFFNYLVPVTD